MIVKKLDGILDGNHVLFTLVIDLVEHGSEGGRFTGARWSGHENQSAWFVAQAFHDLR